MQLRSLGCRERERKSRLGFHHPLRYLKRIKSTKPLPSLLLSDVNVVTEVGRDLALLKMEVSEQMEA